MANKGFHKTLNSNRTEEVASIIEKMPTKFGTVISAVAVALVLLLLLFGWLIKYPEVLMGQIVINTRQAPVKLVATTQGNIILLQNKSGKDVNSGEYIAYVKNEANLKDVQLLNGMLHTINIHRVSFKNIVIYFLKTYRWEI